MTKKGLLRLTLALGLTITMFASASLGIAYGIPSIAQTKPHMRTVVNSTNPGTWYSFDQSMKTSYTTTKVGETNGIANNSIISQLVRRTAVGEDSQFIDKDNPYDQNTYLLNLKDSPHKYKEFLRLELAKAIVVTQDDGNKESFLKFDNDQINSQAYNFSTSINSPQFVEALKDVRTSKLDFIIRKNIPWINSEGHIQLDDNNRPYEVVAQDWLFALYRLGMQKNSDRNKPISAENPFGGYGTLPTNVDEKTWTKSILELSSQLQSKSGGVDLTKDVQGYSNHYLYDIFNIKNIRELVAINQKTQMPYLIGQYGNEKTVSIQRKETDEVTTNFFLFFNKLIVDGPEFSPAPSRYITEVSAKISQVDDIQLPNAVNSNFNIRKYGQFTYGTNFNNTLFSSAFYVAQSNSFRLQFKSNPHYWDKTYLSRTDRILSYTIDYVNNADKSIFAQSMFDQYKNNRISQLPLTDQPSNKLDEIRTNPRKFGLRYKEQIAKDSPFHSKIIMLPTPNQSYLYNDNFAKIWFGSSISDIKNGKMKFIDFMKNENIALRSQMFAAINWYTQNLTVNPHEQTETWNSYFPPDTQINAKDSGHNSKTFYDYKDKLNEIDYFILNDQGKLIRQTITAQDNLNAYKQSKTREESIKSADFKKIKVAFEKTLDSILGKSQDNKIEFTIMNRLLNLNSLHIRHYQQIVEIFTALDGRMAPVVKYAKNLNDIYDYLLHGKSWIQFANWNADYEGAGSWLTSLSAKNSSAVALALLIADNPSLSHVFPTFKSYGVILRQKITHTIKQYFDKHKYMNHLLHLYQDPFAAVKDLKNAEGLNMQNDKFFATVLMKNNVEFINDNEKEFIDSANDYFQKSLAIIDLQVQNQQNEMWFIEFSREYSSLIGKTFFETQTGVPNKQKPQEEVVREWLIWTKLKNGVMFIQDVRINTHYKDENDE